MPGKLSRSLTPSKIKIQIQSFVAVAGAQREDDFS
jgi:hypothetical protein